MPAHRPRKIVSGGQTGVDRGALEAAIHAGLAHGGWCPRGRLSEDGTVPSRYALVETESASYAIRTERNVVDSDATLILYRKKLSGGTDLTRRLAVTHRKPRLTVDLSESPNVETVRGWLAETRPATLNVAGPRESQAPGIEQQAMQFLLEVLAVE